VTVSWSVNHGSTEAADFGTTSGAVTFTAEEINAGTPKSLGVTIIDDDEVDDNPPTESYSVIATWTSAAGATPLTTTGAGEIEDNDGRVTFIASDVSKAEGTAAVSDYTIYSYEVQFEGNAPDGFDVDWSVSDVTTNDLDFGNSTGKTGSIHFTGTNGESRQVEVRVSADRVVELDETFEVKLIGVNTTTGTIRLVDATSTALGTIENDDSATISIANISTDNSEISARYFAISMSNPVDVPVSFIFKTEAAVFSPAESSDYHSVIGKTIEFFANDGPGATAASSYAVEHIEITDDQIIEEEEFFIAKLDGTTLVNGGRDVAIPITESSVDVAIEDNDVGKLLLSVTSGVTIAESAGSYDFDVKLVDEYGWFLTSELPISFSYIVSNGTTNNSDLTTGTFTGSLGTNSITTNSISITDDSIVESNETFSISLSLPADSPVTLGAASTTVTIESEDEATISIASVSAAEGNAMSFLITLSNATSTAVSFSLSTRDGSASSAFTSDQDYIQPVGGTYTFAAGVTSIIVVTNSVMDNRHSEGTEDFFIDLSGLSTGTLGDSVIFVGNVTTLTATGTIYDL
jgi:hypothetical protein